MTQFSDLGLAKPLLRALADKGYDRPTPIQAQAIPTVLSGRDLLGIAQTGTGKTAAFALPILQRLAADRRPAPRRGCRVLVLSPTRELASQIADSFRAYGRHLGLSVAVVFGGVKHGPQVRALAGGIDVLVATPGRLLDHMAEKVALLNAVEVFVLDEADQMLDLGFLPPIRRIVATLPRDRQNLFFSATMPGEIGKLAGELLKDPAKVSVTPSATPVEKIDQRVLFIETERKRQLLAELFDDAKVGRALVFTRTKRGAERVGKYLDAAGIRADAIHGDKSQGQRERALAAFKSGAVRALVATDIAARGIDIDAVTHVVNFELPNVPEAYVHRIGRTARAGAGGVAISLVSNDERGLLKDIQKLIRLNLPSYDRRNDRSLGALAAVEKTSQPETQPRQAAAPSEARKGPRNRRRGRPNQGYGQGGGQGNAHANGNSHAKGQGQRKRHGQGGQPKYAGPRPIASTQPAARWSPAD
ncbi:MAG TPA: DEAD/DEAH box helicase [Caulobacteraceae bacterium]|nr:DEAD/DEAH box helicase [Caulobacteraceae bacterium]